MGYLGGVPVYQFVTSFFANLLFRSFLYNFRFLAQNNLNVARRAHVWVDTTVGTVSAAAHTRGAVDLDMFNNKGVYFKALGLCVRFRVCKKIKNVLA